MNPKGHGEIHYSDTDKIELGNRGIGSYIDARDKDVVEYMERLDILVGLWQRD